MKQNILALKEYIDCVKEAAKAVIKALWHQFQQEIIQAKGKTDKAKREKVLRQLGDNNWKIVTNPDRHLHNLINKSQLKGVVEDNKPFCPAKDPNPHFAFKRPQVQEQDPSPEGSDKQ